MYQLESWEHLGMFECLEHLGTVALLKAFVNLFRFLSLFTIPEKASFWYIWANTSQQT